MSSILLFPVMGPTLLRTCTKSQCMGGWDRMRLDRSCASLNPIWDSVKQSWHQISIYGQGQLPREKLTVLSILQLGLPLKLGILSFSITRKDSPHTLSYLCNYSLTLWLLFSPSWIITHSHLLPLSPSAHLHLPMILLWHQFYELWSKLSRRVEREAEWRELERIRGKWVYTG